MNSEFPTDPREALQTSLTALALGELKEDQARFLRQVIATDPALAETFKRITKTCELLRETQIETAGATSPEPARAISPAPPVELKLSQDRREKLLQQFKTTQPEQFKAAARRQFNWLIPIAAAFAFILVLAGLLMPTLGRSKSKGITSVARSDRESLQELKNVDSHSLAATAHSSLSPDGRVLNRGETVTLAQNEVLARRSSSLASPAPAERPSQLTAVTPVSSIVLPTESQQNSFGVPQTAAPGEPQQWSQSASLRGFYDESGVSFGEQAANLNARTSLGADIADKQNVPVLGDAPVVGKLFESRQQIINTPQGAAGNGVRLLVDPESGKPVVVQREPANYGGVAYGGGGLGGGVGSPSSSLQTFSNQKSEAPIALPQNAAVANDVTKADGTVAVGGRAISFDDRKVAEKGKDTFDSFTYYKHLDVDAVTGLPVTSQPTDLPSLAGNREVQEQEAANKSKPHAQVLVESKVPALRTDLSRLEAGKSADSEAFRSRYGLAKSTSKAAEEKLSQQLALADNRVDEMGKKVTERSKAKEADLRDNALIQQEDLAAAKQPVPAPIPQPEVMANAQPFSTFSLNISDVSFKLATASLERGVMPDASGIRSEEFINAFDYHDPEPAADAPVAFAWERAHYPFAQNRDLLRLSIKTAAAGRQAGRPLNLVLLLDNSGSMERADRVQIINQALRVLASQLNAHDTFSVVTFARTARLWVDGIPGDQAARVADELGSLTPQGGTNLEEAMNLAYQTALRHFAPNGINRVVLLTDGAANLGDTNPEVLKQKVETNRKQGIALDCFGIGWEGYNDDLLEVLTRNGDGRYGFVNTPEEAATGFAAQLAGAFQVAASDVKVQVEFNTNRVSAYRQIGYAKHQLTKEQFRDNTVDAAEIGASESGNALYVIETAAQGSGPLATVRVRYKVPGTTDYHEHEWTVPFTGAVPALEQASPAMRLAGTASAFSEWLAANPYASEVTPDRLLNCLGPSSNFGTDPRPQKLEWMIRQAKTLTGK